MSVALCLGVAKSKIQMPALPGPVWTACADHLDSQCIQQVEQGCPER